MCMISINYNNNNTHLYISHFETIRNIRVHMAAFMLSIIDDKSDNYRFVCGVMCVNN